MVTDNTGTAGQFRPGDLKYRHILVVTYGRSGSTLLQGILNSIEGVLLRGENDNAFYDLFNAYRRLLQSKNNHKKALDPTRAWYGISLIDEAQLLSRFQELAKVILLADRYDDGDSLVYGFKEIRYNEVEEDFDAYLDFLTILFPNTALIFNTRDHREVASSGWWKDERRASVIKNLKKMDARFAAYAAGRENCFSITYKDMVSSSDRLRAMFKFLGAPYRPDAVARTLNTKHSYKPEQKHVKKLKQP